jgi:hypothetical protein
MAEVQVEESPCGKDEQANDQAEQKFCHASIASKGEG